MSCRVDVMSGKCVQKTEPEPTSRLPYFKKKKPRDSSPPNKLSFNRENLRKRKEPAGSVANASEFDSGLKFKRKKKIEQE
ncbi:hypothetical protein V9T40_001360 [Parthenolecanium corni]|uniref:Uncharacterized protein n=1 Tax=Parthenolecanium corni TaxID=536013 RepID=A0AAN9TCP4_9HEMI